MQTSQQHEEFYQELVKLLDKYSATLTKPEILALVSNLVGRLIALQDQRTMTREDALMIVGKNLEIGNAGIIQQLMEKGKDTRQ